MKATGWVRIHGILTSKHHTRIATWNVRTLLGTGKVAQVVNTFHLAILGVSAMHWTGADQLISEDITDLYSGGNKHKRGVGILLSKYVSGGIMSLFCWCLMALSAQIGHKCNGI